MGSKGTIEKDLSQYVGKVFYDHNSGPHFYHVPNTVLSMLTYHHIFTTTLSGRYYHIPHCKDGKTEAPGG